MAEIIYQGLIDIDPDHQEIYSKNFDRFINKIENIHNNITTSLQPFKNNSFLVYHPAWGYFADTYQLKMLSIEDDGKQPGPSGITAIIKQAKNENISVVFVTPQFDVSSAETIAEEINGQVIFADPLMSDYSKTLTDLANGIVLGYSL